MLDTLKRWASAVAGWLWLALSALAVVWAVGKVRSAQKRAEAAERHYRDIYHDEQAEDGEKVLEAIRGHNDAQARAKAARRKAEERIDDLARRDEDLSDLLHRYNRDRLRDEHEAGSV